LFNTHTPLMSVFYIRVPMRVKLAFIQDDDYDDDDDGLDGGCIRSHGMQKFIIFSSETAEIYPFRR
jgi:hypothetical protein